MKTILFLFLILAASIFAACESVVTDIPTSVPPAVMETNFKEISLTEAQAALQNKDVQFIDVRSEAEYAGGHAANALNFPLEMLNQDLVKLDKTKPVYVICETGKRSAEGAKILNEAGFDQVYSIVGGTSAWTAAGLPVEKSSVDSKSALDGKTKMALIDALADERRAQTT